MSVSYGSYFVPTGSYEPLFLPCLCKHTFEQEQELYFDTLVRGTEKINTACSNFNYLRPLGIWVSCWDRIGERTLHGSRQDAQESSGFSLQIASRQSASKNASTLINFFDSNISVMRMIITYNFNLKNTYKYYVTHL